MTSESRRQHSTRRTFLQWVGLGLLSLPADSLLADRAMAAKLKPASALTMPRIMLIRHAEKPGTDGSEPLGIAATGQPDPESLTVNGWQRAGALAQLFSQAAILRESQYSALAQPAQLFASAVGKGSPSQRPAETLTPLANRLRLTIKTPYAKTQTDLLGQMLGSAARQGGSQGAVLVAWEHTLIPDLARAITGQAELIPAEWPAHRFDLIWVLEWHVDSHRFTLTQVDQRLLTGDAGL